jgi:hypothetical protein
MGKLSAAFVQGLQGQHPQYIQVKPAVIAFAGTKVRKYSSADVLLTCAGEG